MIMVCPECKHEETKKIFSNGNYTECQSCGCIFELYAHGRVYRKEHQKE